MGRRPRRPGRLLSALGLLLALVLVPAAPASAHTVSGTGATDFRTTLTSVSPDVAGLHLAVVEDGGKLQLRNDTATEVVVLGYSGEPYLRVGPAGVFENLHSYATYLNRDRYGRTPVPPDAQGGRPPLWRRVSAGRTAIWHDHRTHWMSTSRPPEVAADPGAFHHVFSWQVQLRWGGRLLVATGQLDWVPGPSPVPWLALTVVLLLGTGALGLLRRRWAPAVAAATALAVASDLVHSLGIAADVAGGPAHRTGQFLLANVGELLAWLLGVAAVVLLADRRPGRRLGGAWLAATVGAVLGLAGGLPDLAVLWRSAAPFGWPLWLARLLTAVTTGAGLGLVLAAVAVVRRSRPTGTDVGRPVAVPAGEPGPRQGQRLPT